MPAQRILIPTDFSETSEQALELGLRLGRRFDAVVDILHVRVLLDDPHLEQEGLHELEQRLSQADAQKKQALRPSSSQAHKVELHTHLMRGLSAAETIIDACGKLGSDLVIMGTHGRRGLKHLLLGSVAEEVVRTSPVPVMTTRADASIAKQDIRKVMVAYDFSPASTAAAQAAAAWSDTLQAELALLHVIEPVVYPDFYAVDLLPAKTLERLQQRSQQALEKFARDQLGQDEPRALVAAGNAAQTIVETAHVEGTDLLVLGTRGLNALEHLLLGSVAENVLRRCRTPVRTVRA